MSKKVFKTGDRFVLPFDPEFSDDIFYVTKIRPYCGSFILDALCDGDESIGISINANEVEAY